ncbi:hypothetical protein, partial [Acetobacter pomorum]
PGCFIAKPHQMTELKRIISVLSNQGVFGGLQVSTGNPVEYYPAKDTAPVRVTKLELHAFSAPEGDEYKIIEKESDAAFSIVNLSFSEDGKWKLNDGQNIVWASIEDQEFLEAVDKNEISFAKGDILLCRVLVQQWQTDQGLKSETKILKVLEHRSAARQISLPF